MRTNTTVPMSETLQSLIIAVQNYKAWYYSDAVARKEELNSCILEIIENTTYNYFISLRSNKAGISSTKKCFYAVLAYDIEKTKDTETKDLSKKFSFTW